MSNFIPTVSSFLSSQGVEITYCICGSGKLYNDCCVGGCTENSWYTQNEFKKYFKQNIAILEKMDEDKKQDFVNSFSGGLHKMLEKHGILSKCINPSCNAQAIKSHLFPRNFIEKLFDEGYNLSIDGINKKLGSDSFKTKLWCSKSDQRMFQGTDQLGDISQLLQIIEGNQLPENQRLIGEFYTKTFGFKLKTVIIEMMKYRIVGCYGCVDFSNPEFKVSYLHSFVSYYKKYAEYLQYAFTNMFEADGTVRVHAMIGKYRNLQSQEINKNLFDKDLLYYSTNILIIDSIPIFLIDIIKDGIQRIFIGTTVSDNDSNSRVLEGIFDEVKKFRENLSVNAFNEWIQDKFMNHNPIFYLDSEIFSYPGETYIFGMKK